MRHKNYLDGLESGHVIITVLLEHMFYGITKTGQTMQYRLGET